MVQNLGRNISIQKFHDNTSFTPASYTISLLKSGSLQLVICKLVASLLITNFDNQQLAVSLLVTTCNKQLQAM